MNDRPYSQPSGETVYHLNQIHSFSGGERRVNWQNCSQDRVAVQKNHVDASQLMKQNVECINPATSPILRREKSITVRNLRGGLLTICFHELQNLIDFSFRLSFINLPYSLDSQVALVIKQVVFRRLSPD